MKVEIASGIPVTDFKILQIVYISCIWVEERSFLAELMSNDMLLHEFFWTASYNVRSNWEFRLHIEHINDTIMPTATFDPGNITC